MKWLDNVFTVPVEVLRLLEDEGIGIAVGDEVGHVAHAEDAAEFGVVLARVEDQVELLGLFAQPCPLRQPLPDVLLLLRLARERLVVRVHVLHNGTHAQEEGDSETRPYFSVSNGQERDAPPTGFAYPCP